MTREEHEQARAMGLTIEAGMLVWPATAVGQAAFRLLWSGEEWSLICGPGIGCEAGRVPTRNCAPDLTDRTTYILACVQLAERTGAGWVAARALLDHDPARLAALLRETAPATPRTDPGEHPCVQPPYAPGTRYGLVGRAGLRWETAPAED